MSIVPVVLCGGSGTRLWPLSRRNFAKQHVPVLGGASPFQRTLVRLAEAGTMERPIVITGSGALAAVAAGSAPQAGGASRAMSSRSPLARAHRTSIFMDRS